MNKLMDRKVIHRTIEVRGGMNSQYIMYRNAWIGGVPHSLETEFGVKTNGRYRIVMTRNPAGRYLFRKTWFTHRLCNTATGFTILRICNTQFKVLFGAVRGGARYDITVTKV